MNIIELDKEDQRWKDFLTNNSHLIFHTIEWKEFIENSFNIELKYFAGEDKDTIEFIFPVGIINSILFGKRLISVPFLEYGGFAGKIKYLGNFVEYIRQNYPNYDYLQVREGVPERFMEGFEKVEEAKRFILRLGNIDNIQNNIHKMKRKAIKKATDMNVQIKDIPESEIPNIYNLYSKNMKKFGSPPYDISYFNNFYKYMVKNNMGKCLGAYIDEKLVAILIGFCYLDKVHIVISASDDFYLNYRPNDLLHWEFIKWANKNKYRIFDFGIARENSGPYEFKEKWSTEIKPLNNYYLSLKKNKITKLDPDNKKFKILEWGWNKLPPSLSNKLGHKLREGLGI